MPTNHTSACNTPLPYEGALVGRYGAKIAIATYTIIVAFGLLLTHLIIITKFRLWHTNWILDKIPQIVNNPISQILSQGLGLIAVIPYKNDLYLVWLVVLLIAYDNVFTQSGYTLLEKGHQRMSREYLFFSNCVVIGALVISYNKTNESVYYRSLLTLWSLTLLKFILRLVSYQAAEKAYGIKNTNLVADYMETEHTLSTTYDPKSMEGYKYLVIGEEKVHPFIKPPKYTLKFKKTKEVVTLEQVWDCHKDPSNNKDERIKDVCLSFALFKLLRRKFFGFRAAESQHPGSQQYFKTKEFIFNGLLSSDKEKVFGVVKIELEFLRDFFYTRYPVAFAFGFPVFSVVILVAMFAISLWISATAFLEEKDPSTHYDYWRVNNKNIDYRITNGLLIIIMAMEIFEVLTYVFSDWMKVTMICRHAKSNIAQKIPFINEILRLFCKPKLSKSLNNTIGQYSLLKDYTKGKWRRHGSNALYLMTCGMLGSKFHQGMKQGKAIVIPVEVKKAIFETLKKSNGDFPDILDPLKPNGALPVGLSWLAELGTPLHTIMVWHIATSVCEIHDLIHDLPKMEDTNCFLTHPMKSLRRRHHKRVTSNEKAIYLKSHHLVASSLSKYCAYLAVFAPELLHGSTYSTKRIFDQIILETLEFFKEEKDPKAQYDLIMKSIKKDDKDKQTKKDDGDTQIKEEPRCLNLLIQFIKRKEIKVDDEDEDEENQNNGEYKKIIDLGVELAKYLINELDNVKQWKVMADVWSNLILFLAPSGYACGHLEKLADGGEFITHIWALLYHAGLVDSVSEDFHIP